MAIEAMKSGKKVARESWNEGMWVIYNPGSAGKKVTMSKGSVYERHGVDACEILPHFDMHTVDSSAWRRVMLAGWAPSQSDMDACDWVVLC